MINLLNEMVIDFNRRLGKLIHLAVLPLLLVVLNFPDRSIAQSCNGRVVCSVQLTSDSKGGATPSTNGREVVYQQREGIASSTRGFLARGNSPDINARGEVVYSKQVVGSDGQRRPQIFSTIRGQLTHIEDFHRAGAGSPSINSLGEVVYKARDAHNRGQIFSTIRGQLTFITGEKGLSSPETPEIDDNARVVFAVHGPDGGGSATDNIWQVGGDGKLKQLTFFRYPKKAVQPTIAAETGELVYVMFDEETHLLSLVSNRDGVLFEADPDPGANFGVYPDLSPEGLLVFHGQKNSVNQSWLGIRLSDGKGNQCSYSGKECPPPQTLAKETKPPGLKREANTNTPSLLEKLTELRDWAKAWGVLNFIWLGVLAILAFFWKKVLSFLRILWTKFKVTFASSPEDLHVQDLKEASNDPIPVFGAPRQGAKEPFLSWWHIPISLKKVGESPCVFYEHCIAYFILERSSDNNFPNDRLKLRAQSDNREGVGEFPLRIGESPKLLPIAIRSEKAWDGLSEWESCLTDESFLLHGVITKLKANAGYQFKLEVRFLDRRWKSQSYRLRVPGFEASNGQFILELKEHD